VALYEHDIPSVAAICQPYAQILVVSQANGGAFRIDLNDSLDIASDPVALVVSSRQDLHRSIGIVDGSFNAVVTSHKIELIRRLSTLANGRIGLRSFGSNIDHQLIVATGAADFAITDTLSGFFDIAAGALIVPEAGGRATDLDGNPLSPTSQVAIFSNGAMHGEVMSAAREAYSGFAGFLAGH
jgi:fructose-1,6-bisphosphatase/inositol monophosphatase family enzyme